MYIVVRSRQLRFAKPSFHRPLTTAVRKTLIFQGIFLNSRTFLPGFCLGGSNDGERSFSDIPVFDVHDVCNARSDQAVA